MNGNAMKFLVLCGALAVSIPALAECPSSLPYEELKDCIVVEGAGGEHPASVPRTAVESDGDVSKVAEPKKDAPDRHMQAKTN